MARRGFFGEDPLWDMEQLAQFSDYRLVVLVMINGVSGASPCDTQRTARSRNRETSSYNSYRICGCETGHVRRVGKTCMNGKGAEVYKNIYIKGTQRR